MSQKQKLVYLIRHAESASVADHRYVGRTEVSLTANGCAQAVTVARRLAALQPDRVWVSPSRRAVETLGENGEERFRAVRDPDLSEVDFGQWEGLSFNEISARDPGRVAAWAEQKPTFAFPGGESVAAFEARIHRAARRIREAEDDRLAILTHGGVIRFLLCDLFGLPFEKAFMFDVQPASFITLRLEDGYALLLELVKG